MQPLAIPSQQLKLIELYLSGQSLQTIAQELDLTPEEVSEQLNTKPVQAFITQYLKNYSFLNPIKRVNILEQLIQNKIDEGLNTKKDILDIIKLLQDEYKLIDKNQELSSNNYVALIKELVINS